MTTRTPISSMPPLPPLTLIVATTPNLGIGLRSTLPWPPLKPDLALFARVTKRPPPLRPHISSSSSPSTSKIPHLPLPPNSSSPSKTKNALIMGRKTWDSLPVKHRPLKGRVNVIVSRAPEKLGFGEGRDEVMAVGSVEEGLRMLQKMGKEGEEGGKVGLGRVFVIGGAQIYEQALRMECCERILWTRVGWEGECDVFFPGGVLPVDGWSEGETREKGESEGMEKWVRRSTGEMEMWVGEEGVGGLRREGDVEFEVCMLERVREEGRFLGGVEGGGGWERGE